MKPKRKPHIFKITINTTKMPTALWEQEKQKLTISNIGKLGDEKFDKIKNEVIYKRESGKDKVLNLQYFNYDKFKLDIDLGLTEQYNLIFACDTNTMNLYGEKKCVGCLSVLGHWEGEFLFIPITAIAFSLSIEDNFNPERISWKYFINYINSNNRYKNSKICLFVDSELDKLNAINNHAESVFKDFYLPPNFTFNYASSDTGNYLGNKLLSSADKNSSELLQSLLKENIAFPHFESALLFTKKTILYET